MTDGRLERFLTAPRRRPRPRSTASALALSGFFFLITAAFYIIKPVKESLLIGARPAWWPYADLATALLIGFVVALNARLLDRLPRRTYLTASILFFIASLLAFWYVFDVHPDGPGPDARWPIPPASSSCSGPRRSSSSTSSRSSSSPSASGPTSSSPCP
ncbi:MAG: hypothetical protein M0C28_03195 [Candidatus Moduliflexus flocculans]|nr:hypothetical protein [Candidatus Moduliflexus flocculans]